LFVDCNKQLFFSLSLSLPSFNEFFFFFACLHKSHQANSPLCFAVDAAVGRRKRVLRPDRCEKYSLLTPCTLCAVHSSSGAKSLLMKNVSNFFSFHFSTPLLKQQQTPVKEVFTSFFFSGNRANCMIL
jgi:hypothetical protein